MVINSGFVKGCIFLIFLIHFSCQAEPLELPSIIQDKLFKSLKCLENLDHDGVEKALQYVEEALIQLCPQQQRSKHLMDLIKVAEKEMEGKVRKKNNQATPLLSFVIPCYNRAAVVVETIQSIYSQNLTFPFEIIAIDDRSSDSSYEVLLKFEQQYDNFYAFRNSINKKAPATRNAAVAYARGKYICNADSDDVFIPNSIESMLMHMIENNHDLAFFQDLRFFCNEEEVNVVRTILPEGLILLESMIREIYMPPCAGNRIYTKNSWLKSGGYLESPGHDSWAFSYKLLANGFRGYVSPGSAYRHRIWNDKSNMWCQDSLNKVNNISPRQAVLESPEMLSKYSYLMVKQYLSEEDCFVSFLSERIRSKEFSLSSQSQLILDAYWNEHKGNYELAMKCYLDALSRARPHIIVYFRAIRMALWLKQDAVAIQLLQRVLAG